MAKPTFYNGEIRPICTQGTVNSGTIIFAPDDSNYASISAITLNSPPIKASPTAGPYRVAIYRYTKCSGKRILLYSLSLDEGDIVDDSIAYHLAEGDYLYLQPSGYVNYSVQGLEYQQQVITPPFGIGGSLRIIDKTGKFKIPIGGGGGGGTVLKKPLIGVVGNGGADDPNAGTSVFQSNKLIGIGSRIYIMIDGTPLFNYGSSAGFTLNTLTGIIDISPNIWYAGSGLYIDLNQ